MRSPRRRLLKRRGTTRRLAPRPRPRAARRPHACVPSQVPGDFGWDPMDFYPTDPAEERGSSASNADQGVEQRQSRDDRDRGRDGSLEMDCGQNCHRRALLGPRTCPNHFTVARGKSRVPVSRVPAQRIRRRAHMAPVAIYSPVRNQRRCRAEAPGRGAPCGISLCIGMSIWARV